MMLIILLAFQWLLFGCHTFSITKLEKDFLISGKVANLSLVTDGSSLKRTKLKFAPKPVNRVLELGSIAKIYCKVKTLNSPVIIKWTKQSLPRFVLPEHVLDLNGTLHFDKVQIEDSGNYTCIATSSEEAINATINVSVVVLPTFVISPTDKEVIEGHSTILHCTAQGDPFPTIQWDKDNVLNGFDADRFEVLPNGSLKLMSTLFEDEGRYGCTIGNSGGFKRKEALLTVIGSEVYSSNDLSENESRMTRTVTVTLGAATLYMLLVMFLMIWCHHRRAKRKAALLRESEASKKDKRSLEMRVRADGKNGCENLLIAKQQHHKNSQSLKNDVETHSVSSSQSSRRMRSPHGSFQKQDLQSKCFLATENSVKSSPSEMTTFT